MSPYTDFKSDPNDTYFCIAWMHIISKLTLIVVLLQPDDSNDFWYEQGSPTVHKDDE